MKAALLEQFGDPLTITEIPEPRPGPGQILVRVVACGVCHSDIHLWRGEWEGFKARMPIPLVLGHEVAGRVARLGAGVSHLREGDTVGVPWFHHTCGNCEYCRRDLEVFCDASDITGVTVHGGFAEYLLAWESHTIPIAQELSLAEAAPLFCAGGTVFSALSKVKLNSSVHLGVWGAGGLGHYGLQLGKLAGARVTAVDVFPRKLHMAKVLGADEVVSAADGGEWFQDPQHKVDVALVCATSAEAYQNAFRSLRKNGVLLVVGIPSQPLTWMAGDIIRNGIRIIPSRVSSRQELRELLAIATRGDIHSEIDRFPLQEVNNAMALLATGVISGRAVLELEPDR